MNRFVSMRLEDGSVMGIDFQNGTPKSCGSVRTHVLARQEGGCALRGGPIGHRHHLVPRRKGGSHGPENIAGLCADCHAKIHQGGDRRLAKALEELAGRKK